MVKKIILKRSVLSEKCSKKFFVYNNEKFLNSIGIGIYINSDEKIDEQYRTQTTFSSVLTERNFSTLIELYGIDTLYDLYKKIISNKNLQKLNHFEFDLQKTDLSKSYFENNSNDSMCYSNQIFDKYKHIRRFNIYCMTNNIAKKANFQKL